MDFFFELRPATAFALCSFFLLSAPSISAAEGRPQCKLASLTENCDVFKKLGSNPVVSLPDGTSFPNPLAGMPPAMRDPEAQGELDDTPADDSAGERPPENPLILADLRLQKKMMDVWKQLPSASRVSSRFQTDFSQLSPVPDRLLLWAGKKMSYPPGTKPVSTEQVSIAWPPQSAQASRKVVDVAEIVDFLNQLPAESRKQLQGVLRERALVKREILNGPASSNDYLEPVLPPPSRKTDFESLFKETRALFVDELLKGRDPSALSADEKAAYAKVSTVRLTKADPKLPGCAGAMPNAYYKPEDHSFAICPSYNGWPKAAIMRIMAHEIGHAIDPCSQTVPLLKINKGALAKLPRSPAEWPISIRKNPDVMNSAMALKQLAASGATHSNFRHVLMMRDPKAVGELQKLGLAEVVASPIPDGGGITKTAYACLRDQSQFTEISGKDLASIAESVATTYEDQTTKKLDRAQFVKDMTSRMHKHSQCFQVPGRPTHMCEVMSDAWSAKVMGRYFEKQPMKTQIEKLSFAAVELQTACSPENEMATGKASDLPLASVEMVANQAAGVHPTNRRRIDRIMLTDRRTQKAFGCQADPAMNCVEKIGTNVTPSQAPVVPRAEKKTGTQSQGVK